MRYTGIMERISRKSLWVIVALLAVVVIAVAIYLSRGRGSAPAAPDSSACVNQVLRTGSQGECVKDAQALINLMQTNKLIEACPFTGGKELALNGQFDTDTEAQTKVIQSWVNCYNEEERLSERLNGQGVVDKDTWTSLCTYGYTFPKRTNQGPAELLRAGLEAGQSAGCQL